MGGRGGTGGVALSSKQLRKLENAAQHNDARQNGLRARARYYEYTDSTGKVHKGETGANTPGGTYRASFSETVFRYSAMSTKELERELARFKGISDDNYQKFARSAASKSASQVAAFSSADTNIKAIGQILRRRKRQKR